jgi:hypothetical protein
MVTAEDVVSPTVLRLPVKRQSRSSAPSPKALTSGAVIAVAAAAVSLYVLRAPGSGDTPPAEERPAALQPAAAEAPAATDAAPSSPPSPSRAEELRTMSETYRNNTLLVAIRRAGYVCDDVVGASESGAGVWTASCRDMGGYKIEALDEELRVEPIAHLFDAPLPPLREDPFRLDVEPPGPPPEPRRLR